MINVNGNFAITGIAHSVKRLYSLGVGVRVPVGATFLSSPLRPVLGPAQPPIQRVPAAISPGLKRRVREAHHSYPTSAVDKNIWIYSFSLPVTVAEWSEA
jgi:hypothetical protein